MFKGSEAEQARLYGLASRVSRNASIGFLLTGDALPVGDRLLSGVVPESDTQGTEGLVWTVESSHHSASLEFAQVQRGGGQPLARGDFESAIPPPLDVRIVISLPRLSASVNGKAANDPPVNLLFGEPCLSHGCELSGKAGSIAAGISNLPVDVGD